MTCTQMTSTASQTRMPLAKNSGITKVDMMYSLKYSGLLVQTP